MKKEQLTQFDLTKLVTVNSYDLKPTTKLLLLSLIHYANPDNGWKCWPSQKTLSGMVGVDDRNIRRNTEILKNEGYISTEQRMDNSLVYTLNIDVLRSRLLVAPVKNDSTLRSKVTVAPVVHDRLTNKEQIIEQTIKQTDEEILEKIRESEANGKPF